MVQRTRLPELGSGSGGGACHGPMMPEDGDDLEHEQVEQEEVCQPWNQVWSVFRVTVRRSPMRMTKRSRTAMPAQGVEGRHRAMRNVP